MAFSELERKRIEDAMKPSDAWIDDWLTDADSESAKSLSVRMIALFADFWIWADLDNKGKTTRERYAGGLHVLGGYLLEEVRNGVEVPATAEDFLKGYVDAGDGPLVHPDNEQWQAELDTVCRKLYKYLVARFRQSRERLRHQ